MTFSQSGFMAVSISDQIDFAHAVFGWELGMAAPHEKGQNHNGSALETTSNWDMKRFIFYDENGC